MPVISRFLGIAISIFYEDHAPPHFHAKYGEYEITVTIDGHIVTGTFPKRALRLVLEWAELHTDELRSDWERSQRGEPLLPIDPLE